MSQQEDLSFSLEPSSITVQQLVEEALKSLVLAGFNVVAIFFGSKYILKSYTSLLIRLLVFIIVYSPPIYLVLNSFTELLEDIRRRRCNVNVWDILEKDAYADAKMLEVRPGRRLCVAEFAKGNATSGTTILFVHGSMARLSQFAEQLSYFSARGYRVVTYDYLGCGRSDTSGKSPDLYSTAQHTKDLAAIYAQFCRGHGRTIVVGHSFGSSQIMRLILQLNQEGCPKHDFPRGLVLLGTMHEMEPSALAGMRKLFGLPVCLLRLLHPVLSKGFRDRALHPRTAKADSPDNKGPEDDLRRTHRRLLRFSDATNGANAMHVAAAFYSDFQWLDISRLGELRTAHHFRVLLVNGDSDRITPSDRAEALAKAWREVLGKERVAFHKVDGAGHQVMQEQPNIVNKLIEEFSQSTAVGR